MILVYSCCQGMLEIICNFSILMKFYHVMGNFNALLEKSTLVMNSSIISHYVSPFTKSLFSVHIVFKIRRWILMPMSEH